MTFRNSYLPLPAIVNTIIKDIQLPIRGEPFDDVRYFWSVNSVFCQLGTSPGASFACIVINCFVVVFEFTCAC